MHVHAFLMRRGERNDLGGEVKVQLLLTTLDWKTINGAPVRVADGEMEVLYAGA